MCGWRQFKWNLTTFEIQYLWDGKISQSKLFTGNKTVSKEVIVQFPSPDYGPSSNQEGNRNTSTLVESYYKDVPGHVMDKIRDVYGIDFEMFGYDKYLPFEKTENKSKSLGKWTIEWLNLSLKYDYSPV